MAVNGSTTTSLCVYCKTTSEAEIEKEFHEINDEVGLELQLPTLVEKFFHIQTKNVSGQLLCDECINRLIELYDLAENIKQTNSQEILDKEELIDIKEESNENRIKTDTKIIVYNNGDKQFIEIPNKDQNILSPRKDKQRVHSSVKIELEAKGKEQHENENSTCEENLLLYDSQEHGAETYITAKRNIEQILAAAVETCEHTDIDYNDHIIEEEDNISYNSENACNSKTIVGTEIPSEEFNVMEDCPNDLNNEQDSIEIITTLDDQLIENEEEFDEDTLEQNSESEVYIEQCVLEDHVEDADEKFRIKENYNSDLPSGSNSLVQANENILDIDSDTINSNESTNEINTDRHHNESLDIYCTEEEYLIEEINCAEEYDCIDLNEYFDKAITTKFKDLELNWELECKLCLEKYSTFQDLLHHSCLIELMEEHQCCCIVQGCEENLNDLNSLARHLILQHYDKLEVTPIYGRCPDCQKTFNNILEFNKHSCCRNIKRKAGSQNYCSSCKLNFQSLKRYVFHMQFHLTNHRPKICLLCGSLFNNSNEFFDHIQYEHKSKGSMACKKCDRFFKEKEVYDSHMELHQDSKYQYPCSHCPKKYTNKCGLNLHMDIYHNYKHKPFQCEYCDKEFVNNISYRNHMKTHTPDVQIEAIVCSVCGLITNNLDLITEHVEHDEDSSCFSAVTQKEIVSLSYTCENCSLDFSTIKHLKEHRLSRYHNDKVFYCVICRRKFISLRHMRSHATNHKEFELWQESFPITRYFVCNIGECNEFYPLWSSLYYHKQRRHKENKDLKSENDFKCQFCHQLCTSKMSLAIHVARSHNNSNIRCIHCGQTYKSQKHLQDHIDKLHVEVKCDICYKKFKNRRNLSIHNQSVHLNEKRYFCQHCNKGYFFKSEKDAHEKQVHPEVSYKCDICNFVTNYPKSLEIHLDKHVNQLKFKCTVCTKRFGRKQLLNEHIKRHEGRKSYKCSEYFGNNDCEAAFITYNLLKIHIQKEHKNPTNNAAQIVTKRTRAAKSYIDATQMDDDTIEYLDDENVDDCTSYGKRRKEDNISNNPIEGVESKNDSIEIMVENDLSVDDNEFIIQYRHDVNNYDDE